MSVMNLNHRSDLKFLVFWNQTVFRKNLFKEILNIETVFNSFSLKASNLTSNNRSKSNKWF